MSADSLGGIGPKRVAKLAKNPRLEAITHIHVESSLDSSCDWPSPVGLDAKDFIKIRQGQAWVDITKLRAKFRKNQRFVLYFSANDAWSRRYFAKIATAHFVEQLKGLELDAVVCPNLSCYEHAAHYVWQENRAQIRNFYDLLAGAGLPAVFFTYLESSACSQAWLQEFLELNPDIEVIATGFDFEAVKDWHFVAERLRLLKDLEMRIGRPLSVLFTSAMTNCRVIAEICRQFPGRAKFLGSTVAMAAITGGCRLVYNGSSFDSAPSPQQTRFEIFEESARVLDKALCGLPGFASNSSPSVISTPSGI